MSQNLRLMQARSALSQLEAQLGVRKSGRHQVLHEVGDNWHSLFSVVSAAMGETGWAVFVEMDEVCWLAAAAAGIDLGRVVCVKATTESSALCEILTSGFDVIVFGDIAITPAIQRRVLARARSENLTICTTAAPWQQGIAQAM